VRERVAGARQQSAVFIKIEGRLYLNARKTPGLLAFEHPREIALKRLAEASPPGACIGAGEQPSLNAGQDAFFSMSSGKVLVQPFLHDGDVGHVAPVRSQGRTLIFVLEKDSSHPSGSSDTMNGGSLPAWSAG
jgi:hypothetical protein